MKGFLYDLFVPHTHDAADAVDDALEASKAGVTGRSGGGPGSARQTYLVLTCVCWFM